MEFKYKDLIDKGFERQDIDDVIWFNEYGFNYFILQKVLNTNYYFDWDVNTRFLYVVKHDYDHNILYRKQIISNEQYNDIDELLKNPNK